MLPKDRVNMALNLLQADRIPKGELVITDGFARVMLKKSDITVEDRAEVLHRLGIDLVCIPFEEIKLQHKNNKSSSKLGNGKGELLWAGIDYDLKVPKYSDYALKDVAWWTDNSDLFVFAVIEGAFSLGASLVGLMNFVSMTVTESRMVHDFYEEATALALQLVRKARQQGAHGIILADDIAYDRGTFLPRDVLRESLFPIWQSISNEASKMGLKVLFHADGYIMDIIPDLIEAGFNGLHSIQPSCGMDIALVKKEYGRHLCLMGNIDLSYLIPLGTKAEIRETVKNTIQSAASGGGYIFGSCGGLMEGLPVDNVLEMYSSAERLGSY